MKSIAGGRRTRFEPWTRIAGAERYAVLWLSVPSDTVGGIRSQSAERRTDVIQSITDAEIRNGQPLSESTLKYELMHSTAVRMTTKSQWRREMRPHQEKVGRPPGPSRCESPGFQGNRWQAMVPKPCKTGIKVSKNRRSGARSPDFLGFDARKAAKIRQRSVYRGGAGPG